MLVGEFEKAIIRKLENLRGLPPKKFYAAGLPYLDVLEEKKDAIPKQTEKISDVATILVAPSWDVKSCLYQYGSKFIANLAQAGFNIIIRPHPQSLKVEKDLLEKIKSELTSFKNIEWDLEINVLPSM